MTACSATDDANGADTRKMKSWYEIVMGGRRRSVTSNSAHPYPARRKSSEGKSLSTDRKSWENYGNNADHLQGRTRNASITGAMAPKSPCHAVRFPY